MGEVSLAEVVEEDVLRLDAQCVQHTHARREHQWRAAEVLLDVLGRRMRRQVVLEHHLVDEAGVAAAGLSPRSAGPSRL